MDAEQKRHRRVEVLATILLALAAVATAWSSYQASRWNGEQTKLTGTTNRLRFEATRAQGLSEAQKQADLATFTQWVDAYLLGRTELRDFYFRRFRKEFKPAVVAWIATRPLKNSKAPLSPFVMPQYQLAAETLSKQLDAQANAASALKDSYIQRSTDYVLAVVLFAAALFFAGISSKVPSPRQKEALLVIGGIIFLGTLVWIATSPVSISIS